MMRKIDSIGIALLAGLALLVAMMCDAKASTHWGANYFPNIPLTDQNGRTFHLYDDLLKGKTVVVSLIYTTCKDSCPLETARLVQVQHMLGDHVGKDVFFYSISIDPEHDTPEVLKAYAEKFHAGPGWLFLTGKRGHQSCRQKTRFVFDPGLNRDGHTVELMIGNEPSGQWTRNAATDNPRFITSTITTLVDGWNSHKTAADKSYAQAAPLNVSDKGQYLFASRCAACHTIGHGLKIGPDLKGITTVRDRSWLLRFIQKPDQLLADKDPLATSLFKQYKEIQMPNVRLGPDDTESIVRFLEAQSLSKSPQISSTTAGGEEKHVEKPATEN